MGTLMLYNVKFNCDLFVVSEFPSKRGIISKFLHQLHDGEFENLSIKQVSSKDVPAEDRDYTYYGEGSDGEKTVGEFLTQNPNDPEIKAAIDLLVKNGYEVL